MHSHVGCGAITGIPGYMRGALNDWVETVYNVAENDRAQDAPDNTLRLRLRWERIPAFDTLTDEELLDLIDTILRWWSMRPALRDEVAEMLTAGGAGWRVTADGTALERRVDDTVAAAVAHTIRSATADAADHLASAWRAAYGRYPDPDKVFHEAIRAVESVACPLVEEKKAENGKATLGTVIGELGKNSGHKWELVVPGPSGAPRDVAPLVSMLELLWQAQVSRHGGAPKSRRQDQAEAEAAIHLATTLVQWLGSGALRTSGGNEKMRATPAAPRKYPQELRDRAVRLARESDRPLAHVARDLGVHPEALRTWVRQDEADRGERSDQLSTVERDELRRLRAENSGLRRANDILKAASAIFAAGLDRPRTR